MSPLPFSFGVLALAAWPGAPSLAHERWADGSAVPAWVKAQCCGVADAHHLSPDQVHVTSQGYRVDGYGRPIREDQLLPSPDGSWWVFYSTAVDGTQSPVYCFFGPLSGS